MRYQLDTHIVVRALTAPKKLTADQSRVIQEAARKHETLGISAITLMELATLYRHHDPSSIPFPWIMEQIQAGPQFEIVPFTPAMALDVPMLTVLRDPSDMAIVATARIHGLRLLTSDQRIIESRLVPIIH